MFLYFPQVSWVRHENSHILTAGRYKYTSDERFQPIHPENSNDWLLRIRRVQKSDQGRYECQINTKDHKSYPFNLKVVGKTLLQEPLDVRMTKLFLFLKTFMKFSGTVYKK